MSVAIYAPIPVKCKWSKNIITEMRVKAAYELNQCMLEQAHKQLNDNKLVAHPHCH